MRCVPARFYYYNCGHSERDWTFEFNIHKCAGVTIHPETSNVDGVHTQPNLGYYISITLAHDRFIIVRSDGQQEFGGYESTIVKVTPSNCLNYTKDIHQNVRSEYWLSPFANAYASRMATTQCVPHTHTHKCRNPRCHCDKWIISSSVRVSRHTEPQNKKSNTQGAVSFWFFCSLSVSFYFVVLLFPCQFGPVLHNIYNRIYRTFSHLFWVCARCSINLVPNTGPENSQRRRRSVPKSNRVIRFR